MKTMYDVLKALEKEMGFNEAKDIYEWYCSTYCVGLNDVAPDSVRKEVFGE